MSIQIAKVREFKGHTQAIYTLCSAEQSGSFYSTGADGMVVEWNTEREDGKLFAKFDYPVYCLHNYSHYLLCGGNNGIFTVIDSLTNQIIKQLHIHESAIFDIALFENYWLIAHKSGLLSILNINYEWIRDIPLSQKSLRKLLAVDDALFVTGSDGIIWTLNRDLEIVTQIMADSLTIFALAYLPEKKILLTGGRSAILKLWQDSEEIKHISAHWYAIKDIAVSQSHLHFATCSMDKTIKIWDADNFELLKVIDNEKYKSHRSSVNKILWIEINRFISCSDDGTIMCFEILE